jgi:transcriptional regulator with XRE-family HTH domain
MPASLTPETREHLRRVVVDEVLPRFGKDPDKAQTAAANKLGVNQSTISRFVNGQGGSMKLAEAVAKFLNDSTSRVLGLGANEVTSPKLREIPGFAAAMDEARRQVKDEYRGLDPQRLEAAADHRMVPPPQRIIPGLLIQLALCLPSEPPGSERRPKRKK